MSKQRYHYQINIRERPDGKYFVRYSMSYINETSSFDEPIELQEKVFVSIKEASEFVNKLMLSNII